MTDAPNLSSTFQESCGARFDVDGGIKPIDLQGNVLGISNGMDMALTHDAPKV